MFKTRLLEVKRNMLHSTDRPLYIKIVAEVPQTDFSTSRLPLR